MNRSIVLIPLLLVFAGLRAQENLKPTDEMALLTAFIADFELVPEEGAEIILKSMDGSAIHEGKADVNGHYEILLPEGQKFQVNIKKFGRDFDFGEIQIPAAPGAITFKHTFKIKVIENYVRDYTLENVHFESGSYEIKKDSEGALQELLSVLNNNQKMEIEIAGHTDNVGDDKSNMKLSQQRADAIVAWLVKNGISADRLIAKGYGEVKPLADNSTEEGRQKNRRTQVRVIKE